MGKGYRQGRLGEEIRKIISELLLREIKDPRLSRMVSISAVEVTADGSYATAYVSVLGLTSSSEASEEEKEEVLAAFRSAKGLIKMDTSMEYGRHITKLIHDLGIEGKDDEDKDEE